MQILFSTGSLWSYSLERVFSFAAQAGFDGLELMIDQRWETRQPDYLQGLMAKHQLPITAVHSPFMHTPGWPGDNPGRIRCAVELAETIGAKVVVHHLPAKIGSVWVQAGARFFPLPTPGWNPEKVYKQWLEAAYEQMQAKTAVLLCIENLPAYHRFGRNWNYAYWNTPQQMTRFPHITLDTTHLGTWGLDPVTVYEQLNGRIQHIHLSNYRHRKEHLRPEDGDLPLDKFLAHLSATHYQGTLSLELHPEALDAGKPDTHIIERMTNSLKFCRKNFV